MIALVSGILGFILPFLGEVMKFFKAKADRKHELDVLALQMEQQRLGHTQRLEEIQTETSAAYDIEALKATKVEKTGWKPADVALALAQGLVRPVITFWYFGLYAAVKLAIMYQVYNLEKDLARTVAGTWTPADEAQFGLVMGFWFGNRTIKHMKGV